MIAAVFPGQGSQKPGMGQELCEGFVEAQRVFEVASEAVDIDLKALCFESDEETLRQTQNTQIALFVCSVAAFHVLPADLTDRVSAMAGHSVGEYAALACAGVLDIPTGARLVRKRGELMSASPSGAMSAVLGMERQALEDVCKSVEGIVVIANDNCPGQLVISGEQLAVEAAGLAASSAGAKRVLPLNVSGAFHSPLMLEAAKEMADALAGATFMDSSAKVYSNVTSEPVTDTAAWPKLLEQQLSSPVRWTESVQHMLRDGVGTFIEAGVGEVLSGLIRRIDKAASTVRVYDRDSLANTLHDLVA